MSFRTRLFVIFAITIFAAVTLAVAIISSATRREFERSDSERTQTLVQQFRKEFSQRGNEVVARAERIAESDAALRIAIDANRPEPDYSLHYKDARSMASAHGLDFLQLVSGGGIIVSSAQSPARYSYKEPWLLEPANWNATGAFLRREDLADEPALALEVVRVMSAGESRVYIVAGRRLDQTFLASLVLPPGMRALLYRNLDPAFSAQALVDSSGPVPEAQKLAPLIENVRAENHEADDTIQWTFDAASAEAFHAIPLDGRDQKLLGVLLIGSSHRQVVTLVRFIRNVGFAVGGAGILLTLMLAAWATSRVTSPVKQLASGAREVAAGNWQIQVEVNSRDEIGELARAFNQMTRQLVEQREHLLQAERVAAWRELARRLAHELKNPLFPLQITVENLVRAKNQYPEQFEEVFRESTATLLEELNNLKVIVGRFSDFAKMPVPQLEPLDLNDLVRSVLKLFDAQFSASGKIRAESDLAANLPAIQADPEQIKRALQNLVLNAMDAMLDGGTVRIRTRQYNSTVTLEVCDSGQGLTTEERDRLFTPYYTTKQHGTGLGLAIVQSVVSDHGGKISVESEPGRGSTFRMELPVNSGSKPLISTADERR